MANMMREHVPQETRINYVITAGGYAPNVVPDFAEVFYYVRHPLPSKVNEIFDRVVKAAEGAARGRGMSMKHEVIHGSYAMLPNIVPQKLVYANLKNVGGVKYSEAEAKFATQLHQALLKDSPDLSTVNTIMPFRSTHKYSSTDVGDVSWNVPTASLNTATWVPGTSAHSWQAIAADGISIGTRG